MTVHVDRNHPAEAAQRAAWDALWRRLLSAGRAPAEAGDDKATEDRPATQREGSAEQATRAAQRAA